MPLTDTAIRKAKPGIKPLKLRDGGGLYLLLRPDGARWWRYDYRRPVTGKRNTLSFGVYPAAGLADARERHIEARKLLAAGVDPGEARKAGKAVSADRAANSFAAVADELFAKRAARLVPRSAARERRMLDRDLIAYIGSRPVADVTAPDLLAALRRVEGRGTVETAHRVRALAAMVFRFAIATGRAERNPAADLAGALATPERSHFASITEPAELPPLLDALHGYRGTPVVAAALKLAPLAFVRPGELRTMRWADVDLDAAEWRYTTGKTGTHHIVPLALQAVAILRDLHLLTGRGEYVFPGARSPRRPMSDGAINAALNYMGFGGDVITGHGFRAMARTILDEVMGYAPHLIEHQLAHAVRDPLGRAYNRTAHLPERRKMMQAWADYLDALRTGANVVAIKARANA